MPTTVIIGLESRFYVEVESLLARPDHPIADTR